MPDRIPYRQNIRNIPERKNNTRNVSVKGKSAFIYKRRSENSHVLHIRRVENFLEIFSDCGGKSGRTSVSLVVPLGEQYENNDTIMRQVRKSFSSFAAFHAEKCEKTSRSFRI